MDSKASSSLHLHIPSIIDQNHCHSCHNNNNNTDSNYEDHLQHCQHAQISPSMISEEIDLSAFEMPHQENISYSSVEDKNCVIEDVDQDHIKSYTKQDSVDNPLYESYTDYASENLNMQESNQFKYDDDLKDYNNNNYTNTYHNERPSVTPSIQTILSERCDHLYNRQISGTIRESLTNVQNDVACKKFRTKKCLEWIQKSQNNDEDADDEDGSHKPGDGERQNGKIDHNNNRRRRPAWDRAITKSRESGEMQSSNNAIRALKLIVYAVTFGIVLSFSVASKLLTLLMTSMIATNRTIPICVNHSIDNDEIFPPLPANNDTKNHSFSVRYDRRSVHRFAWMWCLYFATIIPFVFAWLRAVRIYMFKKICMPSLATSLTIFIMETLHCIGLALLLFIILPHVEVQQSAIMLASVCTIPSFVRVLTMFGTKSSTTTSESSSLTSAMKQSSNCIIRSMMAIKETVTGSSTCAIINERAFALFVFALQIASLIVWSIVLARDSNLIGERYFLVPIALVLVSCTWWENFAEPNCGIRWLENVRKNLNKSKYVCALLIEPWKCLILFGFMISHQAISAQMNEPDDPNNIVTEVMFGQFFAGFRNNQIAILNKTTGHITPHHLRIDNAMIPAYLLLAHCIINYFCYEIGKYSCKICIQKVSFAIPITLTIPITVALLWRLNHLEQNDKCGLVRKLPMMQHIFWHFNTSNNQANQDGSSQKLLHDIDQQWLWICIAIVWFVCTQFLNTLHIWRRTSERLANTDQLFVALKYNSVMIDQSLSLNRRRVKLVFTGERDDEENDDEDAEEKKEKVNEQEEGKISYDDDRVDLSKNSRYRRMISGETLKCPNEDEEAKKAFEPNEYLENRRASKKQAMRMQQRENWSRQWKTICAEMGLDRDSIDPKPNPADDETVKIYACATMWHEDANEMRQMLKALLRLDFDQGTLRIAKENYNEHDKYYELEANIFVDDAFEMVPGPSFDDGERGGGRRLNRFVEQLIKMLNVATTDVFGSFKVVIDQPTLVPTPYGAQLIWRLPSGNRLIAHCKDKCKIRDRKRWSQVMYMYYLLAHRLAARTDLDKQRKRKIANNTFVLALDGDISFQPSAVHMVLDLMKKNSKLGAACGRIHPIGSGLIVWYQKFEYAVGHWFQKATEHVFGCVLCSPGCFSLFRARALMDVSVMHRYTTKSSEPLHYVQYDQGEDRWLCTLLLQRGWRIEYCAASDSYTHAPEGFGEFYGQRRRWAPSTMANIIDLLTHYRATVRCNENVSRLYILYQAFLMFGSILSPATIILMIVTAMDTVMEIGLEPLIYLNLLIIAIFTFVCFYLDNRQNVWKINLAMILSAGYAMLMLTVLVSTAMDMVKTGLISPNSIFFTVMMISYILAAILHPQEFALVFLFPIYILLIPSMYLLLNIYSVTNMHVVSWGTREANASPANRDTASATSCENLSKTASKHEERRKSLFDYIDPRRSSLFRHFRDQQTSEMTKNSSLLACVCCSTAESENDKHSGALSCMCCSASRILSQSGRESWAPKNGSNAEGFGNISSRSVAVANQQYLKDDIQELRVMTTQLQSQLPEMIRQGIAQTLQPTVANNCENHSCTMRLHSPNSISIDMFKANLHEKIVPHQMHFQSTTQEQEQKSEVTNEESSELEQASEREQSQGTNSATPINYPKWMTNHTQFRHFRRRTLHEKERIFWQQLIDTYLSPLTLNRNEQRRVEQQLIALRNKAFFGLGFINILVVVLFFLLQSHDELSVKISIKNNFEIQMHPIGAWLVLFFGSLLAIQCIGMLAHRLGTLTHLLAYTSIGDCFGERQESIANVVKRVIQMTASGEDRDGMIVDEDEEDENENYDLYDEDDDQLSSPQSTIASYNQWQNRKMRKSKNKLDLVFKEKIKKMHRENSKISSNPHLHLRDEQRNIELQNTLHRLTHVRPSILDGAVTMTAFNAFHDNQAANTSTAHNQLPHTDTQRQSSEPVQSSSNNNTNDNNNNSTASRRYLSRFTGSLNVIRERTQSLLKRSNTVKFDHAH